MSHVPAQYGNGIKSRFLHCHITVFSVALPNKLLIWFDNSFQWIRSLLNKCDTHRWHRIMYHTIYRYYFLLYFQHYGMSSRPVKLLKSLHEFLFLLFFRMITVYLSFVPVRHWTLLQKNRDIRDKWLDGLKHLHAQTKEADPVKLKEMYPFFIQSLLDVL